MKINNFHHPQLAPNPDKQELKIEDLWYRSPSCRLYPLRAGSFALSFLFKSIEFVYEYKPDRVNRG
jgi:hypothetical protein